MRPERSRLVVLVSGNGSNLQAVLDACTRDDIHADVVAVVCNRGDAFALRRAEDAGVPAVCVPAHSGELRSDYDARLADIVSGFAPDVVVLAGWMRILTTSFLGWFPDQVINLHPALPGELPGVHAIERAWEQFRDGARAHTGVMVHLVPDEGVDDGPVLGTETVPILSGDTLDDLERRIHAAEHRLLVRILRDRCRPELSDWAPTATVPTDDRPTALTSTEATS